MDQIRDISASSAQATTAELRTLAILADLDDDAFNRLAGIADVRQFPAGYRIHDQGALSVPFCLLVSGQISCFRTAPDGTVTVVDVIQPPGHASLQPALTQLPTLVGLETVGASRVILIDGAGLRGLLPLLPSLATALLKAEAMDFHNLVLQVCDLKLRTTAQRLGHYLLELAPDRTSPSVTIRLPFDKRLLAARLGCRQENLSRAFATLRDLGVETKGAHVVLNDVPRLRDYAVAFDEPAGAAG